MAGDDCAHQRRTLGHVCLEPQVAVHRSLTLWSLRLVIGLCINSRLQWPRRHARGLDSNVPLVPPPQTTNSSVGLQAAARPTSPWAIHPNDIPERSTTSTFPEPNEEHGHLCLITGCDNTSRLVRHAIVDYLPWFSNPVMACWICGVQYVKGTKLKDHWRRHHRDVDISTNWGEHRFDDYFRRVGSFVTSPSALCRGEASLP